LNLKDSENEEEKKGETRRYKKHYEKKERGDKSNKWESIRAVILGGNEDVKQCKLNEENEVTFEIEVQN
jgi:hypothetical protein